MPRYTRLVKAYSIRKDGPVVVVIPQELRQTLNIKAGTKLLGDIDKNNRLVFQKMN